MVDERYSEKVLKFKYMQDVIITKGFYEGQKAWVESYCEKTQRYKIWGPRFDSLSLEFEEDALELYIYPEPEEPWWKFWKKF